MQDQRWSSSAAWPQRARVGAQLDGGLLVESVARAFR
jgi:hypothetical protein